MYKRLLVGVTTWMCLSRGAREGWEDKGYIDQWWGGGREVKEGHASQAARAFFTGTALAPVAGLKLGDVRTQYDGIWEP